MRTRPYSKKRAIFVITTAMYTVGMVCLSKNVIKLCDYRDVSFVIICCIPKSEQSIEPNSDLMRAYDPKKVLNRLTTPMKRYF